MEDVENYPHPKAGKRDYEPPDVLVETDIGNRLLISYIRYDNKQLDPSMDKSWEPDIANSENCQGHRWMRRTQRST